MNTVERHQTFWRSVAFSVLVTVVAWLAPALGGSPAEPGAGFLLWGLAPLLVSVLMRAITRDWTDLGFQRAIQRNIVWYIVSLLAYPACMVLAVLVGNLVSVSAVSGFSLGQYLQLVLTAMPIFFVFAIFEEVGWRGYLAPKLAALGINSYAAAAVVALVWGSWHLPYIRELTWDYSTESLVTFIPRFYLATFAFALVFGEIRKLTGTFWPAVIMHTAGNSFGHLLAAEYVHIAPGQEYLASVGNGLFVIAFMFMLGVVIQQWHVKVMTPASMRV